MQPRTIGILVVLSVGAVYIGLWALLEFGVDPRENWPGYLGIAFALGVLAISWEAIVEFATAPARQDDAPITKTARRAVRLSLAGLVILLVYGLIRAV